MFKVDKKELTDAINDIQKLKENFEKIISFLKENDKKITEEDKNEKVQEMILGSVKYARNDYETFCEYCFPEEDLLNYDDFYSDSLDLNLHDTNISTNCIQETIYSEATYRILGVEESDLSVKEYNRLFKENESEIEKEFDRLSDVYLSNLEEINKELKYINIDYCLEGNNYLDITSLYFTKLFENTANKISNNVCYIDKNSIYYFIGEALDSFYEEEEYQKSVFENELNIIEEELQQSLESINIAEKEMQQLEKDVLKEIEEAENKTNIYIDLLD